ncbi:Eukaryotic translation initiation factor 3 subunit K [Grifola frondosa]|uniref:Eukaryotic translation initiation factor 3 subunit K n=1 Tax=Grifola frondosa TaxID=5627 RepID=A0A1C7MQR5_GRIFR|nr:Eukaryotic translation initiation factor 3 subunit K [Grifola frondosa]
MVATASAWVSPPTRTPEIEKLVSGVDRYNPSNVGILEDYLYHQIRSEEYDCLANLAILKLYQFNPDLYNPDVVINILIKALTSSPFPDFNLCISLLDERPLNTNTDEPDPLPSLLPVLTTLYNLLQQCFEDSVREVVIRAVKAAFTRIGAERLGTYLDLSSAELDAHIEKLGWTIDSSTGVISIPPNPDNQIESTVVQENIQRHVSFTLWIEDSAS